MKGRRVPEPPIDHAANLRERLGRVAFEANGQFDATQWSAQSDTAREYWRRIGQAVMDAIVKKGKGHGQISVESIVSAQTKQPFVTLSIDISPTQLTPAKAREVALLLLECADAAESDSVLMGYARDALGLDDVRAAQLLDQFRRYRESMRGKGVDAA